MHNLGILLLASAFGTNIAVAQNPPSGSAATTSSATEADTKVVGPQDSISASGSSPTKTLIHESENAGTDAAKGAPRSFAPGTYKSPGVAYGYKNADGTVWTEPMTAVANAGEQGKSAPAQPIPRQ